MNKGKTTIKDLEIRIAVVEQGFGDIRRRLDHIETKIEDISVVINHGVGAWKSLIWLVSFAAAAIAWISNL